MISMIPIFFDSKKWGQLDHRLRAEVLTQMIFFFFELRNRTLKYLFDIHYHMISRYQRTKKRWKSMNSSVSITYQTVHPDL